VSLFEASWLGLARYPQLARYRDRVSEVALSTDQIGTLAIGVIVGVVLLGFVVGLIVNAIIARIVIALVVIGLGVLVWTQRTSLENRVKNCDTNVSFFGFHTTLSTATQARCGQLQR
jgi:hypothetical protein